MLERLAVHQSSERMCGFGYPRPEQAANLVQESASELLVHAARHALGRQLRRYLQRDRRHRILGQGRHGLGEVIGQWPARQAIHLEGPHEALLIARLNPFRGRAIDLRQPAVEALRAAARGYAIEPAAKLVVPGRAGKESAGEGAVVEAGAADEDREAVPRGNVANNLRRFPRVARGRILLRRIDHIHHVMRNTGLLRERHLVGADVEAAVHGRRIAAHYLAAKTLREPDAERTLAGRGWPDDGHEPRLLHSVAERSRAMMASARSEERRV